MEVLLGSYCAARLPCSERVSCYMRHYKGRQSSHQFYSFFFFPETKHRSLEDVNAVFGEEVAVHYYGADADELAQYEQAVANEKEGTKGQVESVDMGKAIA